MFTKPELDKKILAVIKEEETYTIKLYKNKEFLFDILIEFQKKPSKEDILSVFHKEKLTKYVKYIFVYPIDNSFYYTFDSFTTDGIFVSFNTPDISFYSHKKEIFKWLNTKGNKKKFWNIYEEILKKSNGKKDIYQILEKTYNTCLGIKRRKIKIKKKERHKNLSLF